MKLYKITAIISFIVFGVCLLCSVILGFIPSENNTWIILLQNYAVGIACSILVVIITTLLQFNFEQQKEKNKLISDIRTLFLHYYLSVLSADPNEKTSQQMWNHYYDRIESCIDDISTCLSNLDWFRKKHLNNANDIHYAVLQLRISLYKNNRQSKEDAVRSILNHSAFDDIEEKSLLYAKNDYDKKSIEEYSDKAKEEIEKLSNNHSNNK